MRENCGGWKMGFTLQAIMLIYDWKMTFFQWNFSNKKKNQIPLLPICFPLVQHITCTPEVFQSGGGPSAEEVEDAGPSASRKRQLLSSAHFQIKTIMTGFTCGAATCIPSKLFVGTAFHSQIFSMCTFVRLDLEQSKWVETSDLSALTEHLGRTQFKKASESFWSPKSLQVQFELVLAYIHVTELDFGHRKSKFAA